MNIEVFFDLSTLDPMNIKLSNRRITGLDLSTFTAADTGINGRVDLLFTANVNNAADDLGEEIPGDFDPTSFDMGTIVVDASGAKGDAYVTVTGVIKILA